MKPCTPLAGQGLGHQEGVGAGVCEVPPRPGQGSEHAARLSCPPGEIGVPPPPCESQNLRALGSQDLIVRRDFEP